MGYDESDFLMLSGLQHFTFCRRRWALIHIEQQWAENFRTVDGAIMHKNAHNQDGDERRGDLLIRRAMRVFSRTLGVSGECDVVELHRCEKEGITLFGEEGLWRVFPIEYKRGAPHQQSGDALQLCAQAICLEEMLCCNIPEGAIFYGELRRRTRVEFTDELRQQVKNSLEEMHRLYRRGHTPKVKPTKSCNACSLKELCLPQIMKSRSAQNYLHKHMVELE